MDYSGGGGGDGQQAMHHHMAGQAHQYTTPQIATAPAYQYPQHMTESRGMQVTHGTSNLHPNHMHNSQAAYYADSGAAAVAARQSLATPSTPSQNASPRFARNPSPAGQVQSQTQSQSSSHQAQTTYSDPAEFAPSDRSLPSLDATDDTFDDAYVHFMLYCNPSFSLDTDTTELRRVFRNPPKSDGKSFSTFTLFELLKKLDNKELKTWTELALELGVEKPDIEKGQSSQKVQQYSVRLKRWMRALHIDAFFEYLMGKKHTYFLVVPPVNDPFPDTRDGVPIEEDLAIRAIDPKFRPKRGRRRADDQDQDTELMSAIEPKRPHLDTSVSFQHQRGGEDYPMSGYPASAVAMSAHPDFANGDPWASLNTPASALGPRSAMSAHSQQLRWRNETPSTPHPLSAVTPMSAHPDGGWDAEPQSAITPSSARSGRRRRHGPAVSSAWPSTNTTVNGKLRGRPPSNRSVRDGPFVTFPANPKMKEAPTIDLNSSRQGSQKPEQQDSAESTPTHSAAAESPKQQATNPSGHQFLTPQLPTPVSASVAAAPIARPMTHPGVISNPSSATSSTSSNALGQRPERLQLQVPRHVGGPVHLVTPTLLVNGQLDGRSMQRGPPVALPPPPPAPSTTSQTPTVHTASSIQTGSSVFSAGGMSISTAATSAGAVPLDDGFLTPNKSPRARGMRGTPTSAPGVTSSMAGPEDLKRALVASLLSAQVEGRNPARGRKVAKLKGTEAKDLADAIMRKLNVLQGPGPVEELNRFLCASWLGVYSPSASSNTGLVAPFTAAAAQQKQIAIRRYRARDDGFDSPLELDNDEEIATGEYISETFDIEWTQKLGGLEGHFSVKGVKLPLNSKGTSEDSRDEDAKEESWKAKFLKAEEELAQLRAKVLDAVV